MKKALIAAMAALSATAWVATPAYAQRDDRGRHERGDSRGQRGDNDDDQRDRDDGNRQRSEHRREDGPRHGAPQAQRATPQAPPQSAPQIQRSGAERGAWNRDGEGRGDLNRERGDRRIEARRSRDDGALRGGPGAQQVTPQAPVRQAQRGDWNRSERNQSGDWSRGGGGNRGDWNRDGRDDRGDRNRDRRGEQDRGDRDHRGDWNRGDRNRGDWDRHGGGRDYTRGDWSRDQRRDDDRWRRYRHTHRDWDRPRYRDWRHVRHGYYFDRGYAIIVGGFWGHNYYWWGYDGWRRPYRPWRVGYVLPYDLYWEPIPYDLYYRLPPAPYGCRYVMVDRDILLIVMSTGLILDALMYY